MRYIITHTNECLFIFGKSQPIQTNEMNDQTSMRPIKNWDGEIQKKHRNSEMFAYKLNSAHSKDSIAKQTSNQIIYVLL